MTIWQTRTSRIAYENPWIRVREDAVSRPDGTEGIYGVVEVKHPAVFVVPLTDEDEVVLVEMWRYPTQQVSLEIPAGGSDGQESLIAAQRELREETGLDATTWQDLGTVFSLNGVSNAPGQVFLARGLTESTQDHEQEEEGIVGTRRVPWVEVLDLIRTGAITDGETLAALMHAAVTLGRVS